MVDRRRLLAAACIAGCLGGCANPPILQETVAGAPVSIWIAGASITSYAVLQRGLFDVAYSLITGKDCSLINIERRGEYCRSEAVAEPMLFCTRSLADVDCWAVANPYGQQRSVADIPARAERKPLRWNLSPF